MPVLLTVRAENDPRVRASTQAHTVTVTAEVANNQLLHEFVWAKMGEIMDLENSHRDLQQQRYAQLSLLIDCRAIEQARLWREEQRRQQQETDKLLQENERLDAENTRLADELRRLREIQSASM
jgi:hypothetical protein